MEEFEEMTENKDVEKYRLEFLKVKNDLIKKVQQAEFDKKEEVAIDLYNDVCLKAVKGDVVYQDLLAYLHKKGFRFVLPVNYEKYMQWEILAAGNGNPLAIEKLTLYLNFALNEMSYIDDLEYVMNRNNIDGSNYFQVLGKLICEGIIDEMHLDPESLVKDPIENIEFNAPLMRRFDKARNNVIPKILKFLRS